MNAGAELSTPFEQLSVLQPKLQDCQKHYKPDACGRSNVLFLAQLIEEEAKGLDKKSCNLSFGFFMSETDRNIAEFNYCFYPDFGNSRVHLHLYERLNELAGVLNDREGVLRLLTGDVNFNKNDVSLLVPSTLSVKFGRLALNGDELRKHQSYIERQMIMEQVDPSSYASVKRVM